MTSNNLAIEVAGLTKRYGEVLAVDCISFEARKGELFGFLGTNGAGKTTTINMLTGISRPSSGKAIIAGYNVIRDPVKVKELMGVVPDISGVYDELNAWDNINFNAKLHGVPKMKEKLAPKSCLKLSICTIGEMSE